ncbi:Response regulator receiver:ATP-binding region, ATPase-like:Histidine kinase A, N-terminal [Oceanicola granulosus HTCC2516]|uniref:histidine kinase n=1 Tax=Oceanicola granulosus (strain ATCC BAA-861 / DSM 15982 / KCTC 12143 / HTCC2516) TaxID=314256 RepID=Q2CK09_OCEGH|nr:ATP-binding protein [Oceanicola granulosus]EAR52980.1 Response regulator receiver:ATP-binding region, ATPase-like:Histidine kinase A, N-terminal [Oceanicola granulosus HTCC2516]
MKQSGTEARNGGWSLVWLSNANLPLLMFLASLVVGLVAVQFSQLQHKQNLQHQRLQTTQAMHAVREDIETDVNRMVRTLAEMTAALRESPDMTQAEFTAHATRLRQGDPRIVNFAAAPDLKVSMIHPIEGNEAVLGLDYREKPSQLPGVLETIALNDINILGPIDLVQGNVASILRQPVMLYGPDGSGELWGIVSLVLDHTIAFQLADYGELLAEYDVAVIGAASQEGERRLLFGNAAPEELRDPVLLTFDFPNGTWDLLATPHGGWTPNAVFTPDNMLIIAISAGILGALWYILYLDRQRQVAQRRMVSAIEALDGGFAMYDADDRLIACNSGFLDMYDRCRDIIRPGVRFEDIVRYGISRQQYPDAIGREQAFLRERMELHRTGNCDLEQKLSNGRCYHVSERSSDDGLLVGLRVDITELKAAQEAAEAADQAKTNFMNVLSHELRTPLTVILGHSRLGASFSKMPKAQKVLAAIQRTEVDGLAEEVASLYDDLGERMRKIDQSGTYLLSLINDMLDFSKLSSGSLSIDPDEFDAANLVELVTAQLAPMAEQKGLALTASTEPARVLADSRRCQQILINLIGNALKFSTCGTVSVTAEMRGRMLDIAVSDEGPGIPDDELSRIFEPFHQVDSTATRRAGGTGLGLAIARQLAEMQGGALSATSVYGQGSRFVLSLPLAAEKPATLRLVS